ncbi:hypothetical protein D3C78_1059790 [compost metagenome]
MAIHADCTNAKITRNSKSLIFIDISQIKTLAQRLQRSLHAIQVITELNDMSLIQEKFTSLFSNYKVTTQARPDGGILLTLSGGEGKEFKRSISYQQLHNGDQLTWVISAIRRDLAEQASELPQISLLQSQQRFALPTYHSL